MAVLLQHMLCTCPMHGMTLQGNKEPVMATIWFVFLGFWRLVATPNAWRCFARAVKTARESNLAHCPSNPGRIGVKGASALAWIVTAFCRNGQGVCLVHKVVDDDQTSWRFAGDMFPGGSASATPLADRIAEGFTHDYYSCVWTPAGVIPLPWAIDFFPFVCLKGGMVNLQNNNNGVPIPRRRSPRSQFKN